MLHIAVLDDYQNVALESADFSRSPAKQNWRSLMSISLTPMQLDTIVTTPHVGFISRDLYRVFYQKTVANIAKWMRTRQ
jgi:hypothetical protein